MLHDTKRRVTYLLLPAIAFALSGCSRTDQSVEAAGPDSRAEKPSVLSRLFSRTTPVTIPEGTLLEVRLDEALSSKAGAGSSFTATVVNPVIVGDKTVIPLGAQAQGRVVDSHEGGRLEGVSRLSLELESIEIGGKRYNLDTNAIRRSAANHKKRNWILIGGGSGVGALIGGIAGGGKGALIGTLAGGAAGTGAAAATGKKSVYLPAETLLRFRLDQPMSIDVKS
jgi:hypothetical protein